MNPIFSRRHLCLGLGATLFGARFGVGRATAQETDFQAFLAQLRSDALAEGIGEALLDEALATLYVMDNVIALDRKQPEGTMTLARYLERVVPQSRVDAARARYAEHRALLDPIGAAYGVQPRFIVALWGIESDFGRVTGGFSVLGALATLAFEGRRADFFRKELMAALHILNEGHIGVGNMLGSWAGAMGQSQFMPSSFRAYAVDHDGDGRRDIWNSHADIFASIANYLHNFGWDAAQTWGREVRLPAGLDANLVTIDAEKPLVEWQAIGIRRLDGADLPDKPIPASLIQPDGPGERAFLVYPNYKRILKWNRSTYFATAVGQLADLIG